MANSAGDAASVSMLTVERGMRVLTAFGSRMDPLGNAEIVRRTQIPKAAVSRITTTLIKLGYLKRLPGTRLFQLGIMPLALGQAYLDSTRILDVVAPFMQPLADELSVSTALAVPYDLDMVYMAYFKGQNISTLRMGVGSVLPMFQTSVGYAYLWSLPATEREAVIKQYRKTSPTRSRSGMERMHHAFKSLDQHGFCIALSHWQPDVFGVSVPVRLGSSGTLMSFSCGAVMQGADAAYITKHITPHLKRVAKKMQQATSEMNFEP